MMHVGIPAPSQRAYGHTIEGSGTVAISKPEQRWINLVAYLLDDLPGKSLIIDPLAFSSNGDRTLIVFDQEYGFQQIVAVPSIYTKDGPHFECPKGAYAIPQP